MCGDVAVLRVLPGPRAHSTLPYSTPFANLAPIRMVLCLVNVQQPSQPKVCDLDMVGTLDQHIPGSQVPVHKPHFLQVAHPLG